MRSCKLAYVLPLFVLTFFVNACTTRYIPVESVKRDSVYISQWHRDTVYERDSVLIYTRADTAYKLSYRYIYRDRVVRDTVYKHRRDTIARVVEVEKEFSRLERVKLALGEVFLWIIVVVATVVAVWFARKLKAI